MLMLSRPSLSPLSELHTEGASEKVNVRYEQNLIQSEIRQERSEIAWTSIFAASAS